MYPKRILLATLSILAVSQATWIDPQRPHQDAMIRRQDESSGTRPVPSQTAPSPPPAGTTTSSPSSAPPATTTSAPPPSSAPQESTTAPPSSSTRETTTAPPSTSESQVVSVITTVITTTGADGQITAINTQVTQTSTLGLSGNGGSNNSDMSPETRSIIIGCVVGIGGAIIFGALGFVAWRIWGRKKQADEGNGLMNYDPAYGGPAEKAETPGSNGTGRTPFQSTLESYHAPTQVNASSNF